MMNLTKNLSKSALILMLSFAFSMNSHAQFPRFKVLAFFSKKVEPAHVEFANDAIKFFKELTFGNGFVFDTTSTMADLNDAKLKNYQLVMMLNDFPHNTEQREAFRRYMENGGGWYGFHVAAYNDRKGLPVMWCTCMCRAMLCSLCHLAMDSPSIRCASFAFQSCCAPIVLCCGHAVLADPLLHSTRFAC